MTKHNFELPIGAVTSIVMNKEEFITLFNLIQKNYPMEPDVLENCKNSGMIPLIKRGTKTNFIFENYDVKTDLVSFVVRGMAEKMGAQATEIFKNAFASLPEDKKIMIEEYVQKITSNKKPLEIILEYLGKICSPGIDKDWLKLFREQNTASYTDTYERNKEIYKKTPDALKDYTRRLLTGSLVAVSAAPKDVSAN